MIRLISPIFLIFACFILLSACAQETQTAGCDRTVNYYQQALDFIEQEAYDYALNALDCLIELDPQNPDNYYYRFTVYFALGEIELAIEDASAVISLGPRQTDLYLEMYYTRAVMYSHLGQYGLALPDLNFLLDYWDQESVDEFVGLDSIYGTRGAIYTVLGDYDNALPDLNEALARDAANAHLYATRAYVYQQLGDQDAAQVDRLTALDLDHDVADGFSSSAASLETAGNRRGAATDRAIAAMVSADS